jgi:hypothetical protein
MKNLFLTFLLVFLQIGFYAQDQSDKIEVFVGSRVDTSNQDVRQIIELYTNYLNSRPDSIYDNPYWNTVEKELYKDFDLSRISMFQGGIKPNYLFNIYLPFILSIDPVADKYQIRILFSSNATEPPYVGSKVWCIQKLSVIKENNKWVLENLIVYITENWEKKTVGLIEYVYPPRFNFNTENAKDAWVFCQGIINRFNPGYNQPFKFYITNSIDDMGLLENFDYYFAGITTGKAAEGKILSAKGNESYPHEFVHKLLPENENQGFVINEGLAVFLGTSEDENEYNEMLENLAKDLAQNPEKINFNSVVSQEVRFNGYFTRYPAGAAICEVVSNKKGDAGLKQLMIANTSDYDAIMITLKEITGMSDEEFRLEWEAVLKEYFK